MRISVLIMALFFCICQIKFANAEIFNENMLSSMEDFKSVDMETPVPQIRDKTSAEDIDVFEYFERNFGKLKTAEAIKIFSGKSLNLKPALYSFDISKIKNKHFKTSVSFKTTRGTKVHVSVAKAMNCPGGKTGCKARDKYFIVLTTEKGKQYFIRGREIVNVPIIMRGGKKVNIDGDIYSVKLFAKVTSIKNSVIEIKRGSKRVVSVTIKALYDAVAEETETVQLSKEYQMLCAYELIQESKGAKITSNLLIGLIDSFAHKYFVLNVSDIDDRGVFYPNIDYGFGFRINGDIFEIYRI